ncbi:MAG TPA: VOC family protein [Solirubrobacter sp.]|nr:VOC family protein [Solirubrobacter sp.]
MRLQGLHHLTMITCDAQRNVDFYANTLGLRLVKKTVNFDSPDAYHLYFGDEQGSPGTILTWFEFPGAWRGRPGAGMIHTIQLSVAGEAALDFWARRLGSERGRFTDYDGLQYELVVSDREPRRARHPEIPEEFAITGIAGARAYGAAGEQPLLTETLGFEAIEPGEYRLGDFTWAYDEPPAEWALQGAGTVHHIAWAARDEDHLAWRERVREAGGHVTGVRDRDYFRSIYFREPRGILFEIATLSPGFAVDEDTAHLGEELRLPAQHEHLRPQLEKRLSPVVNPRAELVR